MQSPLAPRLIANNAVAVAVVVVVVADAGGGVVVVVDLSAKARSGVVQFAVSPRPPLASDIA